MYDDKSADYFDVARTEIADLLPATATRVLDVGCGSGATLKWIGERFPKPYLAGVEMTERAARRAARVCDEVVQSDIEQGDLPFQPGSFDLILALDVLEHLRDPLATLARLRTLLHANGTLVISLPNISHYSVSLPLLWGRWNYQDAGLLDRTHLRFFVRRTALELVQSAGFRVDAVDINCVMPRSWRHVYWRIGNAGRAMLKRVHFLNYQFLIKAAHQA